MQNETIVNKCDFFEDDFMCYLNGCYKQLFSTALIHTRNYQDAEDVLQEATLFAYKNFNGLKNPVFFKTWLTKILLNIIRKNYKNTKKIQFLDYDCSQLGTVEINDDGIFISEMLNVLDDKSRSIIILKYFSDYTVPEIALIMKMKEGTVKSRLSRSIKKMHDSFREGL